MATERVPTGVQGLDELMQGGLKKGANVIVSGTPGTGKTTLIMQYIYNGIVKYNEPGIFLSTSEAISDMTSNYAEYGWDLAKMSANNSLVLAEFNRDTGMKTDQQSPPKAGELLEAIRYILDGPIQYKRFGFDSLSMLSYNYDSEKQQRNELKKLMEFLKKRGLTSMYCLERSEWNNRYSFEEFLGEGIIVMHDVLKDYERKRGISVIKMRGTQIDRKTRPYSITKEGIRIFPTEEII